MIHNAAAADGHKSIEAYVYGDDYLNARMSPYGYGLKSMDMDYLNRVNSELKESTLSGQVEIQRTIEVS
jgi:hypothetical protein